MDVPTVLIVEDSRNDRYLFERAMEKAKLANRFHFAVDGLDAVRSQLIGTNTILPLFWEIILLIVFMFVMLWIGITAFRSLERRVRMLGTLGQH